MFDHVIRYSIRNKVVVGMGVLALILWGAYALTRLPIDAVPDITNNQVQVVTLSTSLAAEEIERLVTTPVEQVMASIPNIEEIRSISRFGLSVVTIVFHDNVDVYWARTQVAQRLTEVQDVMPKDASAPSLAPVTTGLGEIYQYVLRVDPAYADRYSLSTLRTLQDWTVRRRILGTPGVADVSSFGGYLRQVEISADLERLRSFGLSVADVLKAVDENNANAGSAYIEKGSRVAFIRADGRLGSMDDLRNVHLRSPSGGVPLRLSDVATVQEGHAIRYGTMTMNAEGETVGGVVLMLKGANSSTVIEEVKSRIADIQKSLPEGVSVEPFLDRAELVGKAIGTVTTNLIEGALIVIFVLVIMLGSLRAGFVVASVIPLSMLFAVGMMVATGVSGNLMSLGAIDFGLIVDAAVIIVEYVMHSLRKSGGLNHEAVVTNAAIRIRRSASIGEFVILIVYVPILALVGVEGRMFVPMAQTVIYAIIGAFILSLTWVPMLSALVLRYQPTTKRTLADRISDFFTRTYTPIRNGALRRPRTVLIAASVALVLAGIGFAKLGGEFLPQLDEGDFAVEMRMAVGTSVDRTSQMAMQAAELLLAEFPEVVRVVGKIGTSEIPLDPMPMNSGDLIIVLKDRAEWTSASTREALASRMEEALAELPGVEFGFQQPIQMRFNELMTGERQDVAIKVFGDDLDTLSSLAAKLGRLASAVDGASDLYVEQVEGLPQLVATIDREACARMGVDVDDVNTVVRSFVAGQPAGVYYEQERRIDIVVRLDASHGANDERSFRALPVPTSAGSLVPLEQVATITTRNGPNQIQHEDTRRRITVGFNIRGRDVQSIVDDIRKSMDANLHLPPGYYYTVGGQFENLMAAKKRLYIVVPVALLIVLVLLYTTFKNAKDAAIIFTAVPLAAVGGIAALLLRGMPFSISAGVGFIALFGVSVLNGIVLIAAFHQGAEEGVRNVYRIVVEGTSQRLRPVMMTALVASLGFLPMALSTSDGAEVQRPLATVVIGGLITSTLLTLIVLPVLYVLVHRRRKNTTPVRIASTLLFFIALFTTSTRAQNTPPPGQPLTQAPLTRSQAIDRAMLRNVELRGLHSRVEQAEAISGAAAVDLGRTSVTYSQGQYNSVSTDNNITIQQTIPFPTVWFAESDLADRRTDVVRSELGFRQRSVQADVERVYERIRTLRTTVSLLQQQNSLFQRAVDVARRREKTGEGTKLAAISMESQRREFGVQRLQAEADLRTAEHSLRVLCGGEPVSAVIEDLDTLVVAGGSSSDAPSVVHLNNQAKEASSVAGAERARLWPDITLGWFSQTLVGTQVVNGQSVAFGSGDRFTGVSIGLHVPLWFAPDAGRIQKASLMADATRERADAERKLVDIRRENTRNELEAARQTLTFYRDVAAPEIDLLILQSTRSWEAGQIGYLEHHASLARAFAIRTSYVQALERYNLLVINYNLLQTP